MFNRKEIAELKEENVSLRKRIGRIEDALSDWRKPMTTCCAPIPLHDSTVERQRFERLMKYLGLTETTVFEHTIITKNKEHK